MTDRSRLWLILALILAAIAVKGSMASAQSWHVAPNTTPLNPPDTAQLPYSVTFALTALAPWQPVQTATWAPVWPRNASGAWYRPSPYTQPSAIIKRWQTYPYSCRANGLGFVCRDLVRAIDRNVSCPPTITIAFMPLWRSQYRGEWPELGLFTWDRGPFSANLGRTIPVTSAVVTNNGLQLNCQYGNITSAGPGTLMDTWVWRR